MHFVLLGMFLLLLVSSTNRAQAHTGEETYFFYELSDEDLHRIDLTDGTVDDWIEILGRPSLTTADFWRGSADYPSDPEGLDVRVWLAWHGNSSTLWVALEGFDDLYVPGYLGDGTEIHKSCWTWDACMEFVIDGDHSGGEYWSSFVGAKGNPHLMNNRQAQRYWMPIDHTESQLLRYFGAGEWVTREPYADAAADAVGRSPATWVLEMKVTPFDDLLYNDEGLSMTSDLYAGKIVGFDIWVHDDSDTYGAGRSVYLLTPLEFDTLRTASYLADGLLVGAVADSTQ